MSLPKIVKVKSGSLYETKESYSRIVAVGDWIFVSNTAGRNYKTREMSPDPVEQAKQCFDNVEAALKAAVNHWAGVWPVERSPNAPESIA